MAITTKPTGKCWLEVNEGHSVSNDNNTWSATRVFHVKTSSPYVAVITIQKDAGISPGTIYEESCDNDYTTQTTTEFNDYATEFSPYPYSSATVGFIPPLRASKYETRKISHEWTEVTVMYEDDRKVMLFDELSPGFKAEGFTSGLDTIDIDTCILPYERWVANSTTGEVVKVTVPGSSIEIDDRTIKWDGKKKEPMTIQVPTTIYWERWVLGYDNIQLDIDGIYGTTSSVVLPPSSGDGYTIPGYKSKVGPVGADARLDDYQIVRRRLSLSPTRLYVSFARLLTACVGLVNSTEFRSYPPYTLMMQAPEVEQLGIETWAITFNWSYQPVWQHSQELDNLFLDTWEAPDYDETTFNLQKRGWEALWYQYNDADSEDRVVSAVCVGPVYYSYDFNLLLPVKRNMFGGIVRDDGDI